ncbi:MAG: FAD-dependent tricarballylate dehydrogenase TcuA [Desulfovibrio sp.]|jgi:tricarballylate dehydrogenase|nr:FAD-dependent tricarballylate dehydrogenase TcuA [Desulfovibrio sp.]
MSKKQATLDHIGTDVLVIGGGNAALTAAITARELGLKVLVLESSPIEVRGGNSRHTRNIRYIHDAANSFLTGPYLEEECYNDLLMVTKGNTTEKMARLVIRGSYNVGDWMMARGCRFQPAMRGTLHLSRTNAFFRGGGKALINAYHETCRRLGAQVMYDTEALDLEVTNGTCTAVHARGPKGEYLIRLRSVVLASGGYQGNRAWLREAWGPTADNFLIRGTPHDKGVMLKAMMEKGAKTIGDPTQGHCVAIDGRAPKFDGGICTRLDCVPFGIVVNRNGQRFYNEGEEFWPKRYAIWGRLVAGQPDQIGYVFIDAKSINLFMPSVFPPLESDTVSGLAEQMDLEPGAVEETVRAFNASTKPGSFNPGELDGLATEGLDPPKTNWARPLDTPPYYGYTLRPGITFTYLSLVINEQARVVQQDDTPFNNIFAAGEITSGNVLGQGYMAGFGMTIGTVFGRLAGKEAATCLMN